MKQMYTKQFNPSLSQPASYPNAYANWGFFWVPANQAISIQLPPSLAAT